MLSTSKWIGLLAVAFVAGSFIASPELRAYAANTIGSGDIIDGQVKTADLANNAVNSAKISDGTIVHKDISSKFLKSVSLADTACSGSGIGIGWCPDNTRDTFVIAEPAVTSENTLVIVQTNSFTVPQDGTSCNAIDSNPIGQFMVFCEQNVRNGIGLNYVVIN